MYGDYRCFFFFSSRRRHTSWTGDWSSDVCSSDLTLLGPQTTVQHLVDHVASALAGPRTAPAAPMLSAALGALADAGPELFRFAPVAVEVPLQSAPPAEDPLPANVLITRDQLGVAEALARRLERLGHPVAIA